MAKIIQKVGLKSLENYKLHISFKNFLVNAFSIEIKNNSKEKSFNFIEYYI
jgi:hypothetical protein